MLRAWITALALAAAACAPPPASEPRLPDAPPGKADTPGFSVEVRSWHLIGDDLTAGDSQYRADVVVPDGVEFIDLWIDRQWRGRFTADAGAVQVDADIADVAAGRHEVLMNADAEPFAFAERELVRSAPLYVVVSNDWDRPDNGDAMLERQERLHQRHPELLLTHLVGPYTFTDPDITQARRDELVDWLLDLRDSEGDEIGLHIHPYCSFVEHAQLTCKHEPSFAKVSDDTGYTVRLGAYSEDEFVTLLETAVALFEENGLGRPTSFRAGGWTLEAHTMRALDQVDFKVDSSAVNWARLEEWEGHPVAELFEWVSEQWAPVDGTWQPYYPSRDDLLATASPRVGVLEIPDNGALVDYVSADEMIDIFAENYQGEPLDEPRAYSIGYHPPNFSESFFQRIDGALDHIDGHLASADQGPVVYARMSDLQRVWPPSP